MLSHATPADWLLDCEPRLVQLEALSRSFFGVSAYEPDGPTKRPLQLRDRLVPARGWGHFLEMRLGKTPATLNEMALLRRLEGVNRFLVLSPNKFKQDWQAEAERLGCPFPVVAVDTDDIRRNRLPRDGAAVLNYEALAQKQYHATLIEWMRGGGLVADESVWLKNPSSRAADFAMKASKEASYVRLLSGKPMTQGPHDLWSQLRTLGSANGYSYTHFKNAFCRMGGFQGKQVIGASEAGRPRLQAMLDSCSWFATKIDWLGIGAPDYMARRVALTPEQTKAYHEMEREFILALDVVTITAEQVVTQLLKLQQINSGFIRDDAGEVHWLVPADRNPRLQEVRYILENEVPDNGKLLVMCQSVPSMDLLWEGLREYQPAAIRGDDWHRQHGSAQVQKARFNEDPACRVLIGQAKAIKYGHTLMGTRANPCLHMVFFENTYSLDDRSQCEERNRGAGQLGTTTVIDLVSNSRDRAIASALARKEDVFSTVMRHRGPSRDY